MFGFIKKMLENDKIRYLIGGGCTTAVNIVTFFFLRFFTPLSRNVCNFIAIAIAIAFAYFINKFFVFRSKTKGFTQLAAELFCFVGVRIISMGIEVLGFAILCDTFRMNELISKFAVQFVVIVANYIFSKLFVFKIKRRTLAESFRDNYCYYIAMGIVFIVYVAVLIAIKSMPFGSNSVTFVDSMHQYLPYISEFRDKLLHEGSLFYSWNIGMGINFTALSAYYLASPFNFLFLLVGKYYIPAMYAAITCMKLMLSAGFMVHLLSYKNGEKERNPVSIAIGVAYAFSNYMIGYSWNIMWMDCIMVLPLIVLGFIRLMEENKPGLYAVSMFYCLYCNYYIGFMICIFMVLWFFAYRHGGIRKFFVHGVRFAFYSLLSGGMAAFSLLPAYFGIMSTAAGDMKLPGLKWYGSIYKMMRQMFFLTKPITNQTFDGNVNLYCGTFAILAIFLYMFVRNISIYEKLSKLSILAFLMISFNAENLNYIWHGMHNQYGIPNRFSFLFIFIVLVMAYDVLRNIKNIPQTGVLVSGFLSFLFLFLCQKNVYMSRVVVVSSALVLVLYVILCMFGTIEKLPKRPYYIVFAVVMCVETLAAAINGYDYIGYANYGGNYETAEAITDANTYLEQNRKKEDGFYRVELVDSKVLDEASWHNMPSISIFGSTVRGELVTTMGRLGFYTGANAFLYMGSTPFTNSMLNVKYVLRRPGDFYNFDFEYVGAVGDVEIYENPYPLSLGFCVDERIKQWDRDTYLPLDVQNSLAYYMTGGVSFFQPMVPDFTTYGEGCTTSVFGNSISYTPQQDGEIKVITNFDVYKDGDYYVNCRGNEVNKIAFYVNGELLTNDRYQIQIFHLGDLKVGDSVTIEYQYKGMVANGNTKNASIYIATYDEEAYKSVYEDLKKNMLTVTEYSDGYVKGTVNVPEKQMLFTSIPYEAGWTVYVDGKKTDITTIGEAFIGVEMEPGEHEVVFRYVPKGFWIGFIATIVSWMLLLGSISIINKQNDRKELVKSNENRIDRVENI